jgi:hypothetical protein
MVFGKKNKPMVQTQSTQFLSIHGYYIMNSTHPRSLSITLVERKFGRLRHHGHAVLTIEAAI